MNSIVANNQKPKKSRNLLLKCANFGYSVHERARTCLNRDKQNFYKATYTKSHFMFKHRTRLIKTPTNYKYLVFVAQKNSIKYL